jgi:hypothetical protein
MEDKIQEVVQGHSNRQLDIIRYLSATGWTYDPASYLWRKDGHAISDGALDDLLYEHRWALDFVARGLKQGAVGFIIEAVEADDGSYVARIVPEWPNVVDVLKQAGADE